jgi:hypothetical protein
MDTPSGGGVVRCGEPAGVWKLSVSGSMLSGLQSKLTLFTSVVLVNATLFDPEDVDANVAPSDPAT